MTDIEKSDDEFWRDLVDRAKKGLPYAVIIRNNAARTVRGEVCTCMTHNKTWGKYSATYVRTNGVRRLACREWDLRGLSLDLDLPDLDLTTIKTGMRVI